MSSNANVIRKSDQPEEISYQYCSLDVTTSQVNCLASVFRFTADVSYLSQRCVESSNVTLNNLSWKVQICKGTYNSGDTIDVTLAASSDGSHSNWSTEAEATIKLHPKKTVQLIEKTLPKTKFTSDDFERTIKNVVSYSDFMSNFVYDNLAEFEIALSTVHLAEKEQTDVDVIKTRLHVMLDDVSNLVKSETSEFVVRGIRWKVVVERIGGAQEGLGGTLAIYLEAAEEDFGNSLSYDVEMQFTLLTFDKNAPVSSEAYSQVFHWGATKGGANNFMRWEIFLDPSRKFILDNRANLLVEFKVSEPKTLWDFYDAPIEA